MTDTLILSACLLAVAILMTWNIQRYERKARENREREERQE